MRPQIRNGLCGNVHSKSDLAASIVAADAIELIPLDEPASSWNITFDVIFHQFTMDPIQDLIVLASLDETYWSTLTLRFCSLKTGLAHPLAEQPLVVLKTKLALHPDNYFDTISVLVAEELLVVNLASSRHALCDVLIIDWHVGVLLSHLGSYEGFCSATYLSSGWLAVFIAEMTGSRERTGYRGQAQLVVADFNRALVKKFSVRESIRNDPEVMKNEGLTRNGWPQFTPYLSERRMIVDIVDEEIPSVVESFTETPIISRLPYRVAVVSGPSLAKYRRWMIGDNRLIGFTRTFPDDTNHEHLAVHYIHD
ncbi:hypothetical protein FRC06_005321 [Ceratobasidium sp. 370]|nr:hypothetical protein FRC06_005321 [Ceratobasidium sp. 370]